VDYSWARPGPAAIVSAGYTGVIRYLSHEPGKDLHEPERDALWAAGLSIGLVWETSANRPLSGYAGGRADAIEANGRADALGWPRSVALFYAVDFAPTGDQFATVRDYFRGVKSAGIRPVGVYGTYTVVEDLAAREPVTCYWQCAAWSGTGTGSGGSMEGRRLSRHACLFQMVGGKRIQPADSTDHNEEVTADTAMGLWRPGAPPPEPPEEIMARPILCADHGDGFPHSGDAQWQTVYLDGKLARRFLGPGDPGRLVLIGELSSANPIELAREDAAWYLALPDVANYGPFLARPKADSAWVVEQLHEPAGSQPLFLFDGRLLVRIHDDHQAAVDRFVGVRDAGEMDDVWFYNQALLPWVLTSATVDVAELAAAIAQALVDAGISADVTAEDIEAIAQRTAEVLAERLAA
jgi:hypothetical protein